MLTPIEQLQIIRLAKRWFQAERRKANNTALSSQSPKSAADSAKRARERFEEYLKEVG